jgi:hypothetical protein
MSLRYLFLLSIFSLIFTEVHVFCVMSEKAKENEYKIGVKVPDIVEKDLIERAVKLAKKVYPDVDSDLLRLDYKKYLTSDDCKVTITRATGPYLIFPEGDQKVASGSSPVLWENIGVRTKEKLRIAQGKIENGEITKDQAIEFAKTIYPSLLPLLETKSEMKMVVEDSDLGWYEVRWEIRNEKTYKTENGSVGVIIRKSDGALIGSSVIYPLEEPKISFEDIIKIAEKEIPGFRKEYLALNQKYHFADRRLVWFYGIPNLGYYKYRTYWDANKGEVLYSEFLKGGELNKAYMNPNFYRNPSENEVKEMVEELLKKRAEELEKNKVK